MAFNDVWGSIDTSTITLSVDAKYVYFNGFVDERISYPQVTCSTSVNWKQISGNPVTLEKVPTLYPLIDDGILIPPAIVVPGDYIFSKDPVILRVYSTVDPNVYQDVELRPRVSSRYSLSLKQFDVSTYSFAGKATLAFKDKPQQVVINPEENFKLVYSTHSITFTRPTVVQNLTGVKVYTSLDSDTYSLAYEYYGALEEPQTYYFEESSARYFYILFNYTHRDFWVRLSTSRMIPPAFTGLDVNQEIKTPLYTGIPSNNTDVFLGDNNNQSLTRSTIRAHIVTGYATYSL